MITRSSRLTLTEGRGTHDKGQVTEEPCDGKLSCTVLKGRRGVAISPADPNYWAIDQLKKLLPVVTQEGWQTSNLRQWLGLEKQKTRKGDAIPATHAVDGVSLAASQFVRYRQLKGKQGWWEGSVDITPTLLAVIRRPPISRRQLHLMVPSKSGVRRKYGGTTTRHGLRKGDYVKAEQAGRVYFGWVSGDTEKQVSVSNADWKRLGQFTTKKVQLLQRSTGLIVVPSTGLSNLPLVVAGRFDRYPSPGCFAEPGVSLEN